jgi:hypothetical protein
LNESDYQRREDFRQFVSVGGVVSHQHFSHSEKLTPTSLRLVDDSPETYL